MNSKPEGDNRRVQHWANWATILALFIAIIALYISYQQLVENRTPADLRMASTLIAIEREKQNALETAWAIQTQQAMNTVMPDNTNATQTAMAVAATHINATSQALSTQAAQIQATLQINNPPFVSVSIEPIANFRMANLVKPIYGEYTFRGIPFTLLSGSKAVFQTQEHTLPSLPRQGTLSVAIPHPVNVYVLVDGTMVYKSLLGRTAGKIVLSFSDGRTVSYDLIVGKNLREHWGYNSGPTPWAGSDEVVTDLTETIDWMNVYQESQYRDGKPATAYIDMVVISVPVTNQSTVLTQIDIIDTSIDNFGMLSPSLEVYGITVATTP